MTLTGRALVAALLLAIAAVVLPLAATACGGERDFPGTWISSRGSGDMVIAERDDGDYDVTMKAATEGQDEMTFVARRDGDELTCEISEGEWFFTLTLNGDKMTFERVGGVEVYLREE